MRTRWTGGAAGAALGGGVDADPRNRKVLPRAKTRDGDARTLAPGHPEYPHELERLPGSPPSVFVRGSWERRGWRVAVVGARRASREGVDLTFQLAASLAARGVEILSGLAKGIDAAAHRGALSVAGRTGAVLGTSLDDCFPPEHAELQETVASSIGLLTERPTGSPPTRATFATRNRLLAALSDAVVVVEGSATSGALLTARYARSMGRPVGAVPWSLWCEHGAAPHALLREGHATLVRGPDDVLALLPGRGAWPPAAELPFGADASPSSRARRAANGRSWTTARAHGAPVPGSPEARVLAALRERPQTPDEIAAAATMSFQETSAILLRFELEGILRREFGGRVRLAPKLRFARAERGEHGA